LITLLGIGALLIGSAVIAQAGTAPLKVGVATNYPPITFSQKGVPAGVEADLARQMEQQSDLKFVLIPMEFATLLPALQKGQIDVIMAGMSITPDREALVSFTQPYLRVGQMALIRERDLPSLGGPRRIEQAGRRVGVVFGTTGHAYAVKSLPEARVIPFESTPQGVAALERGEIDYFVHDAPTVWHFGADPTMQGKGLMGLYDPLTDEPLAWAVRKEDTSLRDRLNAEFDRMRRNGTLSAILDKWMPVRVEVGSGPAAK
jgi:ABC-type amino acid transport substrate-binding protein